MKLKWWEYVSVFFEAIALIYKCRGLAKAQSYLNKEIAMLQQRSLIMERGDDAMITIDGGNMQSHLEAFMGEILEKIQIRASEEGKDAPAIVEYRKQEDILHEWIRKCCIVDVPGETSALELYEAFSRWWIMGASIKKISLKKFDMMMGRDFKKKTNGIHRYCRIGLLKADED